MDHRAILWYVVMKTKKEYRKISKQKKNNRKRLVKHLVVFLVILLILQAVLVAMSIELYNSLYSQQELLYRTVTVDEVRIETYYDGHGIRHGGYRRRFKIVDGDSIYSFPHISIFSDEYDIKELENAIHTGDVLTLVCANVEDNLYKVYAASSATEVYRTVDRWQNENFVFWVVAVLVEMIWLFVLVMRVLYFRMRYRLA